MRTLAASRCQVANDPTKMKSEPGLDQQTAPADAIRAGSLEQQEAMHQKQLQLFLNGRSPWPAATLPSQPYTHLGSCSFLLGLQRLKEYITSVLSLKHCHLIFIKSYHLLLQEESQETNLCIPNKIRKKRKQMAPSPAKPSALLITFSSMGVPFPQAWCQQSAPGSVN